MKRKPSVLLRDRQVTGEKGEITGGWMISEANQVRAQPMESGIPKTEAVESRWLLRRVLGIKEDDCLELVFLYEKSEEGALGGRFHGRSMLEEGD